MPLLLSWNPQIKHLPVLINVLGQVLYDRQFQGKEGTNWKKQGQGRDNQGQGKKKQGQGGPGREKQGHGRYKQSRDSHVKGGDKQGREKKDPDREGDGGKISASKLNIWRTSSKTEIIS